MNNQEFDVLADKVSELSFLQLKRLRQKVEHLIATDQVGKAIADKEEHVSSCPHCGSVEFTKYGTTARGQQRYQCKGCTRTFNSLTGTPLARLRMQDKWHQYSNGMWLTTKLRSAAKKLGINLKTAWLWRHRMLAMPCKNKPSELHGIIEADETFINESFKGRKKMPREPHKRGGGNVPKVPVLLALDRNGSVTHRVLEQDTKEQLQQALSPVLTSQSVLCTDGNLSYQSIVKELPFELDHKRLVALDNVRIIDGIYHIQTLNNWTMRWKAWLVQFHGVGTAYLDNYIAWFRHMDQSEKSESWVALAL